MSSGQTAGCNKTCLAENQSHCYERLSPCTPPSSVPQSLCSSILVPDHYSQISCGSISPISCKDVPDDNDEIKIIITNPHNSSVIISRHDICKRNEGSTKSPSYLPILGLLNLHCTRVLLLFWAVITPALAGLAILIFSGRESLSGLIISSSLFLSSVCILLFILYITKCFNVGVWNSINQYGTLQENNNMAQVLQQENCIITSAENKISWTEFFNGRS